MGSSVVITSGAVGVEGCDSYTSLAVVVGGLIGTGTGVVGMVFTSGGGWDWRHLCGGIGGSGRHTGRR